MKVAIVGGSPSTEGKAPYDDESWEIWVHGNQCERHEGRRITRIFEIHEDLSEHPEGYPQWLADKGVPMSVSEKYPVKAAHIQPYPFDAACKLLEGLLTSTPAYMMALAIIQGAEEIGIYGVDMAVDDHEYFLQRPAMYAWIAYAKGQGIKVHVAEGSPLFRDRFTEGRDRNPAKGLPPFTSKQFLAMADEHTKAIAHLKEQRAMIDAKIQTHDGSLQVYQRLAKVARGVESGIEMETLTESMVIK